MLKCLGDKYTIKGLVCYRLCYHPPDIPPEGFTVEVQGDLQAPYRHGSERILTCTQGYSVEDESNMPAKDTLLCSNGMWTERQLSCRADCPAPERVPPAFKTMPMSQDELAAKPKHKHGDEIRVVCIQDGEEQVLKCQDGK